MAGFFNAGCDKAMFGWPCDKEIESLRDHYARETDQAKLKPIAEAVQVRVTQYPTHIHLGQWYGAAAVRKNIDGMIEAPVTVFWNVQKKGALTPACCTSTSRDGWSPPSPSWRWWRPSCFSSCG